MKKTAKEIEKKTVPQKGATGNARTRARGDGEPIPDEVIDALLSAIAGGKSLVRACELPGMPNRTSFLRRVADDAELQKRYALAMDVRADVYAEETIDIADDGRNDTYIDDEGNKRTDHDVVARSKLRIAARQWYAAKIAPKKYGEKLAIGGAADLPPVQSTLDVTGLSTAALAEIMKARDAAEPR